MDEIIVVGGGGFGREVICWAEDAIDPAKARIKGILDDALAPAPCLNERYPYAVLGAIDTYVPTAGDAFVVAIGNPSSKRAVVARLMAKGARFHTLIHPTARVARTARLGAGAVMCPFSLVSADAQVGDFVTINAYSSLGHDAEVGHYSTISSHVDLTGGTKLGTGVFVGSHACLLPGVCVGDHAKVGAGAVVVRRVAEGVTVYAQPAKTL